MSMSPDFDDEEHTNVFVKFLPADIDDNRLRSLFEHCGTIISSKVMVNQNNGESLGYGYANITKIIVTITLHIDYIYIFTILISGLPINVYFLIYAYLHNK